MKVVVDAKRDVIPRWRPFIKSIDETRSLGLVSEQDATIHDINQDLINEWNVNPTLTLASEIVSSAYVTGSMQIAIEAARMVRKSQAVSSLARSIAGHILGKEQGPTQDVSVEDSAFIREARARTILYPGNAIAWVDLALGYVVVGKMKEAKRALWTALAIAPDDRFVLRSVTRFLLHQGEKDLALQILRSKSITKHDPWLMVAEIALCEAMEKSSPMIKSGRKIVLKEDFSPHTLSELSSEIATIEYRHGDIRSAAKLFRKSLMDPTENVIAQAGWASRREKAFLFDGSVPPVYMHSSEAMAWEYYRKSDWKKSGEHSRQWFMDQPFSVRPALLGSSVYGIALENFQAAIEMCEKSFRCNPKDEMLINNFAYNLAMNNEVERARRYFDRIPGFIEEKPWWQSVVYIATRGLIKIRSGKVEEGIEDYTFSIDLAMRNNDADRAVIASSHLALELKLLDRIKEAKRLLLAAAVIDEDVKDSLSRHVFARAKKRILNT